MVDLSLSKRSLIVGIIFIFCLAIFVSGCTSRAAAESQPAASTTIAEETQPPPTSLPATAPTDTPTTVPTTKPTTQKPTPTSCEVCSCSGDRYNCGDFKTQSEAQACYDYCRSKGLGDVHKLDADEDGITCESLK